MKMIPIKSSNIKAAGYENGTLRIQFSNGSLYDYHEATAQLYNDFMEAESQGRFFHQKIKSKLTSTKVEKDDDNGEF